MIKIPWHMARRLREGTRVTIRLTEGVVSRSLRDRRVTEDEIEQIAERQLEQRDNIIRFLEAEGGLSNDSVFARRAASLLRRSN